MSFWSVSQLNRYIKKAIDSDEALKTVNLEGEISNFKRHSASGHCYFSLKDEGASINCVMFRGYSGALSFNPENGMSVLAQGRVSVYERSGSYQFYVERMSASGVGNLQRRYLELKEKLAKEGLFKSEKMQRPLPPYPNKIGIVTSQTGAVIQDMVTVMRRRYPSIELILAPASVQGRDGAASIVKALSSLYERSDLDLIILARGGGSMEDLWNFNEEAVIRQIALSPVPLVSAVGHETDVTLADFAADLRAGTPSIAAEQCVPDRLELIDRLKNKEEALREALQRDVQLARLRYEKVIASSYWENPLLLLTTPRQRLDEKYEALEEGMKRRFDQAERDLDKRVQPLLALNPLAVLSRGYALCEDKTGQIIDSVLQVERGDELMLRLADGKIRASVIDIEQRKDI